MKPVSPFKFAPTEDGPRFVAEFPLAVDVCPGTINKLVVEVTPDPDDDQRVVVSLAQQGNRTRNSYGGHSVPLTMVESLLFGAARVVTKRALEVV